MLTRQAKVKGIKIRKVARYILRQQPITHMEKEKQSTVYTYKITNVNREEGVQYRALVESDEHTDESVRGLIYTGEKKSVFTPACGERCTGSDDFFDRLKSKT